MVTHNDKGPTPERREVDLVSGVETTGHEWDGLKELNNPAPRWWLWVFYVTVIWSLGYYILYPSWPTISGATQGVLGYTQYKDLAQSQSAIKERQQVYLDKFEKATDTEVLDDPQLYAFAIAGGGAAFKDNCATCHGAGGAGGRKGYPNLTDDDWLWGGKLTDIQQTLKYGIRSGHDAARVSQMPAFGRDGLLKNDEINAVVDYVLTLSGGKPAATFAQGKALFAQNCISCHGETGGGGRDFGAPNLRDHIWLYGGDRATVFKTVYNSRGGVMPAWEGRLDPNTIRQLAIYIHQLGGGENEKDITNEQANPTGDGAAAPTSE